MAGRKVILLKPFVFSAPPVKDSRIPREVHFKPQKHVKTGEWIPTEVELAEEIANHPYITEHFADGAIERPEVTQKRLETAVKARKAQDDEDKKILHQAQAAFARAQGTSAVSASDEELKKALNTPVNELQKQQGESIAARVQEEQQQSSGSGQSQDEGDGSAEEEQKDEEDEQDHSKKG